MRAALAAALLVCCLQSAVPAAPAVGTTDTMTDEWTPSAQQCVAARGEPHVLPPLSAASASTVSTGSVSAGVGAAGADARVADSGSARARLAAGNGLPSEAPAHPGGSPTRAVGSASSADIVVKVHAHVLRTKARGGVARARIRSQVDVLNAAFAGRQSPLAASSPFRFRLASADVTTRRQWSRLGEGTLAESRAKRSLHRGTSEDLNLYIAMMSTGVLGWGTQPTRYREQPKMDGVVVARSTLPGGQAGRHSAGDSAVHETGHWLGLLHTFAGGCGPHGDRVADTAPQAKPNYGCHPQRNTCSAPGRDPVHNFMDYGDDACMDRFTAGQVVRMRDSWQRLRNRRA